MGFLVGTDTAYVELVKAETNMKRFNDAVELADNILGNGSDRMTLLELVQTSARNGWDSVTLELLESALEVGYTISSRTSGQ